MTLVPTGGALLAGALVVALARLSPAARPARARQGSEVAGSAPLVTGARRGRRPGLSPRSTVRPDGRSRTTRGAPRGHRFGWPGVVGSPRAAGAIAVAALVLSVVVLGLVPALGVGVGAVVARAVVLRAARRRRRLHVDEAMPELIDLFVIAASAGHPVHRCLDVVADRAPEPVRGALASARSQVARGAPLADGLRQVGTELGTLGPSLTEALVAGQRTGAPLAPALRRVAATARDRRRRAAEEAARRLPVTLLFPLVCCILPAFGLLAVVPLLAGSLGSLRP